jgi:stage II sporulation protein D
VKRRALVAAACAALLHWWSPLSAGVDFDGATIVRVGVARPAGGYSIATMPLDTYVARVLAGEAARNSPPAALEALAITVRTYALANRNRHRADGFDLCDQTHCQVLRAATPATERAAAATTAQVLLYEGSPASVYYHASCGGRTEVPSNVWPGASDPPFLPSQDDDACGGVPAWDASIGERDLLRALKASGFRGDRLSDLRIVSRTASGRVARLKADGLQPDQISGQDLRVALGRTLGWQYIKSAAFELKRESGAYRFSGHGSGHGVGLCVIGSVQLAARGRSADQILDKYFPGLRISRLGPSVAAAPAQPVRSDRNAAPAAAPPAPALPPPIAYEGVVVALPDGDEGERDGIAQIALTARNALARDLSLPAPPTVTVRFHPTTDDYQRITGQPWFTTGAVVNGEVHMPPLAVLRDRDLLDRTIRRELVHLMTDAVLAKRPAWVREGAAAYFADQRSNAGARTDGRTSCPDDQELLRPVSAGALSNAYARARACFARQIESGRAWRDVR